MFQPFFTFCKDMSAALKKWHEDMKKWSDMQSELYLLVSDYLGKNPDPDYHSRLAAIRDKYIALGLPEDQVRRVEPSLAPYYYPG